MARKSAPKKRTSKVRQIKRSLKKTEYVQVKNAKGQFRKHRKDLKVVLWVIDRKSGKTVGVLNSVKEGKPVARRFSGGQKTVLSKPKVSPGFEVSARSDTFRIYSKEPIVWQLPRELASTVKRNAKASPHGTTIVSFELVYKRDFHLFSRGIVFSHEDKWADIRMACAKEIIDTLYNINVRISAKVHSEKKKHKLSRYVDATTLFSNF